jgi:phosphoserine aminotransferase
MAQEIFLLMTRVFNFGAGPAVLPEAVLHQAALEMLDCHGSGMSVMEMSHRGPEFMAIHARAQVLLRELLNIPDSYKVLFLQGGGIGQNALVPMNLLREHTQVDYVDTGEWSKRSIEEAANFAQVNVVASSREQGYTHIPPQSSWKLSSKAAYVHICANETIGGVEFHSVPDTGRVPLVADMSSNILSRPIDVSRYGLIYAGAQKNIGPAGLTIVIVREDLLGGALPITPHAFDYTRQAQADSMLNTPPTYAIYMAGLVFEWIKAQGGLLTMATQNRTKAALLYDYLDASGFYTTPIAKADRSLMNVPFKLTNESLNEAFLHGAQAQGLVQLKGHRLTGGMRASIYNAMPLRGVQALVAYLQEFAARNG